MSRAASLAAVATRSAWSAGAIVVAAGAGFLLGQASAREVRPASPSPRSGASSATSAASASPALATIVAVGAELAEISLPRMEADSLLVWRGAAAEAEKAFARHGLALDLADEEAAFAQLKGVLRPAADADQDATQEEELAALLDARAAIESAADRPSERDALLRLARRLDHDPTRDSIRAPLLANDMDAVRIVAAGLDLQQLRARSAALLGAALLNGGDVDEALQVWRAAATEHPEDPVVHLLLGWRLLAISPPAVDEARRHLEAARSLLPQCAAVKVRLESMR